MTSNKNSYNFNDHPEMNDGYSFFNNEIPKQFNNFFQCKKVILKK